MSFLWSWWRGASSAPSVPESPRVHVEDDDDTILVDLQPEAVPATATATATATADGCCRQPPSNVVGPDVGDVPDTMHVAPVPLETSPVMALEPAAPPPSLGTTTASPLDITADTTAAATVGTGTPAEDHQKGTAPTTGPAAPRLNWVMAWTDHRINRPHKGTWTLETCTDAHGQTAYSFVRKDWSPCHVDVRFAIKPAPHMSVLFQEARRWRVKYHRPQTTGQRDGHPGFHLFSVIGFPQA